MNSERKWEVNLNIKKVTRGVFITVAFFITLSFSILFIIDSNIQIQSSLVDLITTVEHNTSGIDHSLHRLKPTDIDSKRQLSTHTDKLNRAIETLLAKKLSWSLNNINDSSLYYFSIDSGYTKDEIVLAHLANLWKHLHKDLTYLIHDDITQDSSYRSYEEVVVLDENNNDRIKLFGIERHNKVFSKKAKSKIESCFLRIEKIQITVLRLSHRYDSNLQSASTIFNYSLLVSIIINFIALIASYTVISKKVMKPISYINSKLDEYNKGEFNGKIKISERNEIGRIQLSINKIINNILVANEFVKNIRDKNMSTFNQLKESKNPLLNSLREMSNELKKSETEEKERNWIIEGQAEFSELLSKHTNNFQNLVDAVISNLVKYIDGLQGAIFIVNEEDNILELVSSFAYDRKKFITKRVELGEGLVGQAWHEEKYIQLDDIPASHTQIKSGMGHATPKNILIVPLIDNQKVYGIIELASFKTIEKFQREFVLRISENIAATLNSVEVNNKTQKLLQESQLLTEKMKEQEEEMLQNMEELQATQDDITRREFQKEQELKGLNEKVHENSIIFDKEKNGLNQTIKNLEGLLEESKEDNEKIRDLESNIIDIQGKLDATEKDLNETIRMKNLKIEKMRKKLSNSTE